MTLIDGLSRHSHIPLMAKFSPPAPMDKVQIVPSEAEECQNRALLAVVVMENLVQRDHS
jgi:hypothetical protein